MPVGVRGSLKAVLEEAFAGGVPGVSATAVAVHAGGFRPANVGGYPCVVLVDEGTERPESAFSSGDAREARFKVKTARIRVEVFALGQAAAELLGEAVENVLESKAAVLRVATLSALDPDGIVLDDLGGEKYVREREWPAADGTALPQWSFRGELRYAVEYRREVGTWTG